MTSTPATDTTPDQPTAEQPAREPVTVAVDRWYGGQTYPPVDVTGSLVLPGLAITPRLQRGSPVPGWFNLTHIPSGLELGVGRRCPIHIEKAAEAVQAASAELGIDWTVTRDALLAEGEPRRRVRAAVEAAIAASGYGCRARRCGEDFPTWRVRCDTCDWEWYDEDDDGPIDGEEAKEIADDHRCDPFVKILPGGANPYTGWVDVDDVNDDGTLTERASKRHTAVDVGQIAPPPA